MSHTIPTIAAIEQRQLRKTAEFRVGDFVKVHYLIREGDKERTQVVQGHVIRKSGAGIGATFCVRKVTMGVGVERIFPLNSPRIEKIEIVSRGQVRRARLFYLRELQGKKARLRDRGGVGESAAETAEAADAAPTATE